MRHTLLTPQERKSLRRDYRTRLAVVCCFLISTAFLVGAVSLFPAFINTRNLAAYEEGMVQKVQSSEELQSRNMMETRLRSDSVLVERLLAGLANNRASDAIGAILGERGPVQITAVSYNLNGTSSIVMVIQGKAQNRNDLSSYKSRIEASIPKSVIDLPWSDFAKSKDIAFSMKLTYPNI